jgi:hypothetical protein
MKRNPTDSSGEYKYKIYVNVVSSSETVYTLGIRRLTMDDGGTYTCMLMLPGVDNANYPRQSGQLTVQRKYRNFASFWWFEDQIKLNFYAGTPFCHVVALLFLCHLATFFVFIGLQEKVSQSNSRAVERRKKLPK